MVKSKILLQNFVLYHIIVTKKVGEWMLEYWKIIQMLQWIKVTRSIVQSMHEAQAATYLYLTTFWKHHYGVEMSSVCQTCLADRRYNR